MGRATNATSCYFASTPLHVIFSAAVALHRGGPALLCIIDQPPGMTNTYAELLNNWSASPFDQLEVLHRHSGLRDKLAHRKQLFARLAQLVAARQPTTIYTGSDRRVEFQYAISRAGSRASGVYIDEGTFSYSNRKASRRLGDRLIDNLAKKVAYGGWWSNPPTTGASSWIDACLLMYPQLANKYLQHKQPARLEPGWITAAPMVRFLDRINQRFGVDMAAVSRLTHLITLPHHSVAHRSAQGEDYARLARAIKQAGGVLGVKLHPRNLGRLPEFFTDCQPDYLVPSGVAFEALLPGLPDKLVCIGDVSTTMMTSRWLRPDIRAVAFRLDGGGESLVYQQVLEKTGVEFINPKEQAIV